MDNTKIYQQWELTLAQRGVDSSFLEDPLYNFEQKFALYRSARLGHNLHGIANPDMPATEMEDIIDEQLEYLKYTRAELGIDTSKYTFEQIYELNEALTKGLDVTHYKSHEFSAEHMHIAKTFQEEGLPGIEQIHPDKSIPDLIQFRAQTRQILQKTNTISDVAHKSYELYNAKEKYLEQSDKAYALEYPAYGEPHYLAVNNKDEILQFMKKSVSELSEEAVDSYQNDTLEEFASKYARDELGDLPTNTITAVAHKSYELYNTPEKYLEQSDKAYALEYPAYGEPHYLAVNNKDEILQFMKKSVSELSEEAENSYQNDTLEEFASKYARDDLGDLPLVYDRDRLQLRVDYIVLNQGIQQQNSEAVNTQDCQPANSNYEIYDSAKECIEHSNKDFVIHHYLEDGPTFKDVFVAVDSKEEIQQYFHDEFPSIFKTGESPEAYVTIKYYKSAADNLYISGSFEDYAIAVSNYHLCTPVTVYEMHELQTELENAPVSSPDNAGINKMLNNTDEVLTFFEKISPEVVKQLKTDGYLSVPGVNGGTTYLSDNNPEYLAKILNQATGNLIDLPKKPDELVQESTHELKR